MPTTPMPEEWRQVLASSKSLARLVSSKFDQRPCLKKKRKEKESKVRGNRGKRCQPLASTLTCP